jgi:SAM-dependent methyltransferase
MTATGYVLGREPREHDRLREQALWWEPSTAALLDRIGLAAGSRCLDVGCGPGETMRLLAERVARGGKVVGLDVDGPLGAQAIEALHGAGHVQCAFVPFDVEGGEPIPGGPYDLVFARLLLLYVDDPVTVLRRLWGALAPGGHLVIQDHDLLSGDIVPALDSSEEFFQVVRETFRRTGRDMRPGLHLAARFAEAGIGEPDGMDVAAWLAPLPRLAPMYEEVYRSILPAALSLGATTEQRAEAWFEAFARESAGAGAHAALWPLLIGAWKEKA